MVELLFVKNWLLISNNTLDFQLLESADASDKSSRSILLYLQKNTRKLIQETSNLRAEKQDLIREVVGIFKFLLIVVVFCI